MSYEEDPFANQYRRVKRGEALEARASQFKEKADTAFRNAKFGAGIALASGENL